MYKPPILAQPPSNASSGMNNHIGYSTRSPQRNAYIACSIIFDSQCCEVARLVERVLNGPCRACLPPSTRRGGIADIPDFQYPARRWMNVAEVI